MDESNRNEQLQAGRKSLQAAGKSPRQVGQERAYQALLWIYRWGWSTPSAIELLTGGNRSGLATRLEKRKLLVRTRTASGGGQRDVPAYILTLSESGLAEVERGFQKETDLLPYDIEPYRVNQSLLRHDNIGQLATIRALNNGDIDEYRTERELAQRSEPGIKQPDIMWFQKNTTGGTIITAIEIELSAKWSRDLDQFIHSCVTALIGPPVRFQQIFLITDSPAIHSRYQRAFGANQTYGLWKRNQTTRHWSLRDDEHGVIPEAAARRFICKLTKRP